MCAGSRGCSVGCSELFGTSIEAGVLDGTMADAASWRALTLDLCPQFETHAAFSLVVDPSPGVLFLADTTPALGDVWPLKKLCHPLVFTFSLALCLLNRSPWYRQNPKVLYIVFVQAVIFLPV